MTEAEKPQKEKKPSVFWHVAGEVMHEFAGKLPSRKLTVWTVATIAFFTGKMDGDLWAYISLMYVGSQAILDYGKSKFSS